MGFKELMFKFFGLSILIGSLLGGWLYMDAKQFLQTPLRIQEKELHYLVEPGMNIKQLAKDLAAKGILDKPEYLVWLARWQDNAHRIKSGEYVISAGTTPVQFLDIIVQGKAVQHALTLIEGLTFREMMAIIRAEPQLKHTLKGVDNAQVMAVLGWPEQHPEGRFYPDTYHFPRATTDVDFLKRAHRAMEKQLSESWQQRAKDLPYKNAYEALIMASIVEKETGQAHERAEIAGVFVRRLKKKMRLQTDPTVIYGLGDAYDGNIRKADLRSKSPYNTYRHRGLPPTPIAMPGGDAIRAALNPAPGDALYFVARGDGTHQFSSNLDDHNAAVIKYQLRGRKRAFSSMPVKQ
ncbi:MAG: endolytic transglycosylase MltG [Gammaproteobacteria bacterium]|nr:endolytic transglycosylase MltG [Gammaproteobacteria bacterium]